ncbi:hypothetical protein AF67_05740 [Streptococcus uberis 6780]|nr:hypothetical protein AF67_05740 [Streptococcus uberis 6780]
MLHQVFIVLIKMEKLNVRSIIKNFGDIQVKLLEMVGLIMVLGLQDLVLE